MILSEVEKSELEF